MQKIIAFILSCSLLAGCSNDQPPQEAPNRPARSNFGYRVPVGVLVEAEQKISWFKSAVSNAGSPSGVTQVILAPLQPAENCTFPRPPQGVQVVQIQVDESQQLSDIFAIPDTDILRSANSFIGSWQKDGREPVIFSPGYNDHLGVVDVVVTASEKPVYLVLAGGRNVMWNIHKAPNARIHRVAIISLTHTAIANLEAAVPVSVIDGKAANRCQIRPARSPKDHWTLVERAKKGEKEVKAGVSKLLGTYNAYNKWFNGTFGVQSEASTIGFDRMSHAIVGPVPASLDERIPYNTLDKARVLTAAADHLFFAASNSEYEKVRSQLVKNKARAIFGSDLTALDRK
ncbi:MULTISPECIES: hypothetical protein [Rhizobium]|uniref:hypothetical protein n=1 Tax=Rhizobium TaxID=379 RepID=UPI001C0D7FD1|nr:hypothetical protein [Rhizobium sp. X9]